MSRRDYLRAAMAQSAEWLRACAADPSAYMTPAHALLLRVAIRRKERAR